MNIWRSLDKKKQKRLKVLMMAYDHRIGVQEKFDQLAGRYVNDYLKCNSLLDFEKYRRMQILIETALSYKPTMVLDMGCGPGFVISELRKRFPAGHFIGIDLSYQMLREASKLYPQALDLAQALAQEPPLKPDSFDLICALGLVDYLERTEEIFASVHCLLKPGGLFIFSFPNADSMYRKIRKRIRKLVGSPKLSAVPISVESVFRLLNESKLEVLETQFITYGSGAILFPWTFTVSLTAEKFLNSSPVAKYLAWSGVVVSSKVDE